MGDLDLYDYHLPEELIARQPLSERDASKLLVVRRQSREIEHRSIRELPQLLDSGDCLTFNDTRVLPARLLGRREATGGHWEGLYLDSPTPGAWRLIGQTRGKLREGERIEVLPAHAPESKERLILTLVEREADGAWLATPKSELSAAELLQRFGTVPLPPYIERTLATPLDWERYQTLYAKRPGAVAAPTAGLHFSDELQHACRQREIERQYVTLHVGVGTFRPITVERLADHRMHSEWCDVSESTVAALRATRARNNRIVAVGTTTARTLETAARDGELRAWSGPTELFIRPPYEFRAVDALLTNFHLPRSSLLVMLSAFAGLELIREAYSIAVEHKYRFYSYGDAMLVL